VGNNAQMSNVKGKYLKLYNMKYLKNWLTQLSRKLLH